MPQPQDGEKFCGARINYRTKEPATCCADRSDDCTFIMSDGVSTTSALSPLYFRSICELIINSKLSDHASVMHTVSEKKVTVAPITLTNVCQISSQQWCPRQHLLRGCLKATQVQLSWIHFSSDIEETFHFKFEIKKCPKIFKVFFRNFHWKFIIIEIFRLFFKNLIKQNLEWKAPQEKLLCVITFI